MVQVVYLWDFEDGTTQGLELGTYVTLDNTGKVQGTYSLRYTVRVGYYDRTANDLLFRIPSISIANTTRPLLLMVFRDMSGSERANKLGIIRVVIKNSAGVTVATIDHVYSRNGINNFTRIIAVDLTAYKADVAQIEVYRVGVQYGTYSVGMYYDVYHYIDMIAIVEPTEVINRATVAKRGEALQLSYPLDRTLAEVILGLSLVTPPYFCAEASSDYFDVTAVTDRGSVSISPISSTTPHSNMVVFTSAMTRLQRLDIYINIQTITENQRGDVEAFAIINMPSGYTQYLYVYLVSFAITLNPVVPGYQAYELLVMPQEVRTITLPFSVKLYANESPQISLVVQNITRNPTKVSGTATLTVEGVGSVSVDLSQGEVLESDKITIPVATAVNASVSVTAYVTEAVSLRIVLRMYIT